ncbi:MAG: transglutaminase domain-containing protein [Candidatus Heimdallarchaeota archaeon]|nr:transglutaminase domain-containing protein [Candidatus Heimdallarchaeota archaeon]
MNSPHEFKGWQFHHEEYLQYRTTGSPTIHLKFYHYPSYRQKVTILQPPQDCKLKRQGKNNFFIFHKKVNARGSIKLDRKIYIEPTVTKIPRDMDWGKISVIPQNERTKYQESSQYWALQSPLLKEVFIDEGFLVDDFKQWVRFASNFVLNAITTREIQETRLGAHKAIKEGVGDCDEFTDLFITLTRSRGIPSRRLTGYHISKGGSSVEAHAWAEIYSPTASWIPIDLAMNNIGLHSQNYVIWKIEEFNPALPDYQISVKHSHAVHHQWFKEKPLITPILRSEE